MATPDRAAASRAIEAFLTAIGRDVSAEPDLAATGARVADAFVDELCAGYAVDTTALLAHHAIDAASPGAPALVVVRDIPVVTTCLHHLMIAIGSADVAFEPRGRIVGIGALPELVAAHARRLTLQESIGEGVVADLDAALTPAWAACRIVLAHGCMIARGSRAPSTRVETMAVRGTDAITARAAMGAGAAPAGNVP